MYDTIEQLSVNCHCLFKHPDSVCKNFSFVNQNFHHSFTSQLASYPGTAWVRGCLSRHDYEFAIHNIYKISRLRFHKHSHNLDISLVGCSLEVTNDIP